LAGDPSQPLKLVTVPLSIRRSISAGVWRLTRSVWSFILLLALACVSLSAGAQIPPGAVPKPPAKGTQTLIKRRTTDQGRDAGREGLHVYRRVGEAHQPRLLAGFGASEDQLVTICVSGDFVGGSSFSTGSDTV
jgi:hypothetical protein